MNEELVERLRDQFAGERGITEKRMFGGHAFLVNGHLAVSASHQGGLLLRCDPAETDVLIADPAADRFVMRGREMNGWLHITIIGDDESLARWVAIGVKYARSLPVKT